MDTPEYQVLPPQNIEAERALLGSILLDPVLMDQLQDVLEPRVFYRRAHQLIYQAMQDLHQRQEPIDLITLSDALNKAQVFEDVGGADYLSELVITTQPGINIEHYVQLISDKALLRTFIELNQDWIKKGYDQSIEVEELLERAEYELKHLSESNKQDAFVPITDIVEQSIDHIQLLATQDTDVTGLSTGFYDLDKMTTGLHPEELVIIAARPSVGKTAFALNLAQNVAKNTEQAVAIFSLEMSADSLVQRMLCSEGSIPAYHLRTGKLSETEWEQLYVAANDLSQRAIYIDDTPGIKITELRARCKRLAKTTDHLSLIVIDYLQLIEGTGRENRQQEVSEISRQLKKLAKELKVPVIALSQLSRSVEQRQDKRPILSDIRESGSIEQDADIVAFLYRDDYYDRDDPEEEQLTNQNIVEVIIEKNRSGSRGTVELLFFKEYNKFQSVSLRSEELS